VVHLQLLHLQLLHLQQPAKLGQWMQMQLQELQMQVWPQLQALLLLVHRLRHQPMQMQTPLHQMRGQTHVWEAT